MGKNSRIQLPRDEYKKLCNDVYERDHWRCRICKRRSQLHVHHVVFRSRGGDDIKSNLLTVCNWCHHDVHHPHPVTGACVVILSGGQNIYRGEDKHLVNTDDFKYTSIMAINGWMPRRGR
jgi:5-methylcytosine-specific restriction endonuclease McrA